MNWLPILYIALGLLAFPLCALAIVALAGGMLIAEEVTSHDTSSKEQNKNE